MTDDDPNALVPPTMEHVPPDLPRPPAPPDPLGSSALNPPVITTTRTSAVPHPPHHSVDVPTSRDPQPDNHDLIRSLEALQVTVACATPSSSRATPSSSPEPAPFNLLLMVADPVGNAAPITEYVARSNLTNLWRGRVQNIDEVTTNLFLAGFVSEGDMMSIIRGQPWSLRSHNLLIEMYVPDRERDDYAFQYLDASVRLYGIPRELRTEDRIKEIIQHIGHASDWHRLNPRSTLAMLLTGID